MTATPSSREKILSRLKTDPRLRWGAGLAALLLVAAGVWGFIQWRSEPSARLPSGDRAAIEAVVRDYILEHPEIIPEAIQRLQQREVAKLLDSNREAIETPFGSAWAGAKDGDVVLVEFFDYACPYCRASIGDVKRLLAEDKDLKVVWRDFPVLGEASQEAAMASLSAAKQGRYKTYYDAMFSQGRPSRQAMIGAVRSAGMNEIQTASDLGSKDLQKELQKNLELGRALGLTGTPSYVVGNQILSGAVGYDELKKAIAKAREETS